MSDDVTFKIDGLEKLLKALKMAKPPVIRIGILGSKNARTGKASSNATVGAAHEFGTSKLPMRSFLRMPLSFELPKAIKKSGAIDKDVLNDVLKEGTFLPWLKKIAILAERTVAEAFETSGFGQWRPSNMTHKKVHQTLVETQQLRNSITSEIKE